MLLCMLVLQLYFLLCFTHCLFFILDPKTASETETDICAEWEIKTITSALKTYLRQGLSICGAWYQPCYHAIRKKVLFSASRELLGGCLRCGNSLCVGTISSAGPTDYKSSLVDGLPLCNGAMSDLGSFAVFEKPL